MNESNQSTHLQEGMSRRKRILLLVVVAAAVLGLLAATVLRNEVVGLFRHITYSQSSDSFAHNAQSSSLFLGMGDDLLICTQSQVQVFSPTGTEKLKQAVEMTSPALNASGDYAVVYDVGGQSLLVISNAAVINQLTLPEGESLLCATVNEKGWVAVTSKASGYKGVVTVYNRDFESVLTISLSSRYVSDAVVTPDCGGVYLISPGQADGAFVNTLLYYTISSREEPTKEVSLGTNVILAVRSGSRCWIMGDQDLYVLDSSGVITASYHYEGRYLRLGTLQGDGYAALFLTRSSSTSSGTLVTVGADGKAYGALDFSGQTLALAAQSRDVALLTTAEIITADRKLESYTTFPNQQGVRNLAVYADGSVALVNSAAVSLYFSSDGTQVDPTENEAAAQDEQTSEAAQSAQEETADVSAEAEEASE